MTVCIGIACDSETESKPPKLICIADALLSSEITSTERGLKFWPLADGWFTMFAGEDVSYVSTIMRPAQKFLADSKVLSESVVMQAMVKSYQAVRTEQVENTFLSPYGWKLTEFIKEGKRRLPESLFLHLGNYIETYDLKCQFLVCGFSSRPDDKNAYLFVVDNPGVARPKLLTGCAAIGSGEINAVSYLMRREQHPHFSLAESLYNGIAAKVLAEKATGVGRRTVVGILEKGQPDPKFLNHEQTTKIRTIWEEEEADIRPQNLEERISTILA